MRDLCFVDLETTGLEAGWHEIIELAAVRVHPTTLCIIDLMAVRVRPERIERATTEALAINGYTPEAWADAVSLKAALVLVSPLLAGAMVAGHNVSFDLEFLEYAYTSEEYEGAGLTPPDVDYHRLDTVSLAWPMLVSEEVDSLSLDAVCHALGIARPTPHTAMADAMASLEVARLMGARRVR